MRALAKLIRVNSPDLVLFVGEALVGNEAVDQLVKFNRALVDHSEEGNTRTIDGIVLTKFDTIDDKVVGGGGGVGSVIAFVTVFGKTNRLARKTNFFFIALLPFTSSEDAAVQI